MREVRHRHGLAREEAEVKKYYKLVRKVYGKRMSLYHWWLEEHGLSTEYREDQPTPPKVTCFVFDSPVVAWAAGGCGFSNDIELWEVECKPRSALRETVKRYLAVGRAPNRCASWMLDVVNKSKTVGLWIDEYSHFATEVRLVRRMLREDVYPDEFLPKGN